MVKNYLSRLVASMDTSIEVWLVWLRLRCAPRILFGFCYIPPSDSPYFSYQSFSAIQEKISNGGCYGKYVIIGDVTAGLVFNVREVSMRADIPDAQYCSYLHIPDQVPNPNNNAVALSSLCMDFKLVIVNNLKVLDKDFVSNLTYKQGQWTSEMDICMVSYDMIKHINRVQCSSNRFSSVRSCSCFSYVIYTR